MQLIDGRPVYAATDLVGYLACEHLTALERAAATGLAQRPERNDPELDIIRKRGYEHEQRYLADLRRAGKSVTEIALDGSIEDRGEQLRAAAQATIEAMAAGPDVIFQATFFDGTWRGHADFLLRVDDPERPSAWGPYHYEVADTKLARHVKASAVLQICSYVDQLDRLQGVRPEWMHVVLGGSARASERLRVDDFMAYYRMAKSRFLAAVDREPAFPPIGTYPEPVDHCDVCRWAAECAVRRRADDHLSLVAGISSRQRRALVGREVSTLADLGRLEIPLELPLEGTSANALKRVREQARIQLEGRLERRMKYELLLPVAGKEIEKERGLATLPPPSRGDLFFDIEGDPYAFDDGLDYLFGILETDGTFHAIWSRDDDGTFTLDGERRAFERLMDFIIGRLDADPTLHVYHYAAYEPTALKRLMGRYGTREAEVDRLLRGGVLVDLLRAVRQSLRASVESYSIKKIEPLYGFEREVDLRDAGSSIVAFEEWLELGEGDRPAADHLDRIERYNRDDVVSNARLRDWLETLRDELAGKTGQPVPRPADREGEPSENQSEAQARVQGLVDRLTAGIPTDELDRSPEQQATWLLAQLLGWHRREDKSMWWAFFHWMLEMAPEELIDEPEPLGPIEPVAMLDDLGKGKEVWRYRYRDQEFDLGRDGEVYDPAKAQLDPGAKPSAWKVGNVTAIDAAEGTVDVRRNASDPHPPALVPLNPFRTADHQRVLLEIAEWVLANGIDGQGPYQAGRDLLLRRPPRAGQRPGQPLIGANEPELDAARRAVLVLDRSTLAIQGPPGSGKTWTGARMICSLLSAGRRVGITATSHKVICNLLDGVLKAAEVEGVDVRAIQKADKEQWLGDQRVLRVDDAADVRAGLDAGRSNLAAGTSWLWTSRKMTEAVDVLVVDEAGQISLANVLAMTASTASIVLLGDPQQLDQPLKGSHPPGADRSALSHLLGDRQTMPPEQGLFLERTWRLHPDLTRFTSEVFYDGRLESEAHLTGQRLAAPPPIGGAGPRFKAVPTQGFDNESPPEAAAVAELARSLVEGPVTWTDAKGRERQMTWADVLIVAPYNAQVAAIRRLLPAQARVGTVDKFQGQEAPVSIYSMTTSDPEHAPRGMDFLYSRNRLNVATSRARCVAVVVASPDLIRVRARNPKQMRLANALCRLVELAADDAAAEPVPAAAGVVETLTLWGDA